MISPLRQTLAFFSASLLAFAPLSAGAQAQSQAPTPATQTGSSQGAPGQAAAPQTPPPQTAPNESQLQFVTKPNPKYAKKISDLGEKALSEGRLEEALTFFQEAARYSPQDNAIIERLATLRSRLVRQHMEAAERDALEGHADTGTEELAKALLIDPTNTIVAERIREMKAMNDQPPAKLDMKVEGLPELKPRSGRQNLDLRGDTKTAYEQVGNSFGIKMTFDPDLQPKNVRLRLDDVDFDTALKVLGVQTGTFFQATTRTTAFVAQDTPEKRRQYSVMAEQTFPLPAAVTNEDMTEALRVLREITVTSHISLDTQNRSITMRDVPERLALAGELLREIEKARGEIMLEVEILEVDRNKAFNLGILPPLPVQLIPLSPQIIAQAEAAQSVGTLLQLLTTVLSNAGISAAPSSSNISSVIPPVLPVGGGYSTFLLYVPAVAAQFSDALTLVHSGRQVLLRAQDGKPASFFLGDRYPITLSLLSGSLGASTPTTSIPIPTNGLLPSTSYSVGVGPVSLTAGDFRDNGLNDLAVLNELDNSISILTNQGAGIFLAATGSPISLGSALTTPPPVPPQITTTQFTGSGFNDLLLTDPLTNSVVVLLSNGDDTFKEAPGSPITVGKQPGAIVTGDFNGNGNQGFIVANFADNTYSVFFGNSDGTFTQATGSPFPLPGGVSGPVAMVTADFNGDGVPDLAIVNQATNNVSILLGNGNGTFTQANNSPITVGKTPVALAAADLIGNSHQDLAVLNQADSTVSILLGNGDGTFSTTPTSNLTTGPTPNAIAISDINGDGIPDIGVTDPTTNSVSVYLGIGGGSFATPFEIPVGSNPTAILPADLAGGATPDVAVTDDPSGTAGQVTVILSPSNLFTTTASPGSTGVAQQPYPGSEYEDIGVKVKATPTVHAGDEVTLQLEFEIRALAGSSVNGIPVITNRTLSQTVRVKEDETTLIGGLLDNEETRSLNGIPGFANLPGVGYAFGQRSDTVQDTELILLITPHKLRLRDRTARPIFIGRDPNPSRTTAAPAPAGRQP
jgi:Flp pilus assembly secretin CpaC